MLSILAPIPRCSCGPPRRAYSGSTVQPDQAKVHDALPNGAPPRRSASLGAWQRPRAPPEYHDKRQPRPDLPDDGRLRRLGGLPARRHDAAPGRVRAAQVPRPDVQPRHRRGAQHPAQRHRLVARHEGRPHGLHPARGPGRPGRRAQLCVGRVRQRAAVGIAGGRAHVRGCHDLCERVERAGVHEDERERRERRHAVWRLGGELPERGLEAGLRGLPRAVHQVLRGREHHGHPPGLRQ